MDEHIETNLPDSTNDEVGVSHDAPENDESLSEPLDHDSEDSDEPESPPDDDSEEIEHEGQKYKVPKALKGAFLMHSDYTRKTQELAEQRKETEAAKERYLKADSELVEARAQEKAIETSLKEFEQVDWNKFSETDPVQAQKLFFQYQQLKDLKNQATQRTAQLEQTRTSEQQQHIAKLVAQGQEVLSRDIPNWNPDTAKKVSEFAVKEFGFTNDELRQVYDPRLVKVLHAAMIGNQVLKQSSKPKAPPAQVVKPVTKVSGNSTPAKSGLRDDLPMAEWIKTRNQQLSKHRGR
jgi:hypothetical protein